MRTTPFALSLVVLPTFVSAGLFSESGPVKMLQDNIFRKSLKSDVSFSTPPTFPHSLLHITNALMLCCSEQLS